MRNDVDFGKYNSQRHAAIRRGISWELTFEQWIEWWKSTGKYAERGRKGHEYCMCRTGDEGPYALNNIYTVLQIIKTRVMQLKTENGPNLQKLCRLKDNIIQKKLKEKYQKIIQIH